MNKRLTYSLSILFFATSVCNARYLNYMPTFGGTLNSADFYELSGGFLAYPDAQGLGYGVSGVVNHNKIGVVAPLFFKSKGQMHNCHAFFLRPRYEYYWNRDDNMNYLEYEQSVLGLDVGAGISGCSPMLSLFAGIRHETKTSNNTFVFGFGINL